MFSSVPYKHTSVLALNFAVCVLGNIESDLPNRVFCLLAVAFWGLWRYSEIEKWDLNAVYGGLLKLPSFLGLVLNTKYLHFRCCSCSFNCE